MATIGCARQRHDSAAIRIEKLKNRGQRLTEIRAENHLALKVKPKSPEIKRATQKNHAIF
jgi:hypothetical protein